MAYGGYEVSREQAFKERAENSERINRNLRKMVDRREDQIRALCSVIDQDAVDLDLIGIPKKLRGG